MEAWKIVLSLLPEKLAKAVMSYPMTEELRLRLGKAPGLVFAGKEQSLPEPDVSRDDLQRILEKATGASLHAAVSALSAGYIAYNGLRIGVCGEAVYIGERLSGLRNISSLSIRIPHAVADECGSFIDSLLWPRPESTLICAPPGVGKTSFLRELIRRSSELPLRVAVIDERNELSASFAGVAQYDLGQGSDVVIGIQKKQAAMMLLRGMNPQIIAMDEIIQEGDLQVIEQIAGCGVLLYATAHGKNREDMNKRPLYNRLLEQGFFHTLVSIRCIGGRRIYERESLT